MTRVTITGRGKALVENHRGILRYGPEEVAVSAGRGVVRLCGEDLTLAALSDMELAVSGILRAVTLEE